MCLYLPFKYDNTFNNAMFKWFWTILSLGAPEMAAAVWFVDMFVRPWKFLINTRNPYGFLLILSVLFSVCYQRSSCEEPEKASGKI